MNQEKFDALVRLGYQGTMEDMERLYYAQGGSYAVSLQDAEHTYLRSKQLLELIKICGGLISLVLDILVRMKIN